MRRPVGAAAALVLVLAALMLVVLGARSDATRFSTATATTAAPTPTTIPDPAAVPSERPQPVDQNPHSAAPRDFAVGIFVLVVLLVIAFVVLMFPQLTGRPSRRRRNAARDPDPGEPAERSTRRLTDAVEQGLRDVGQGTASDAIIACWLRLERAAAGAGTVRRAADTAEELTTRVLARHRVTPATLRRLADLYREARYSGHALGEAERDQARQALEQVRGELRGPSGGVRRVGAEPPATGAR